MKDPFPLERGRVVISTQGRDKGRAFIILENEGNGHVRLADGRSRRLEKPKKKKTIHVRAKPLKLDLETLRKEGGKLQNSDLRRALEENGFAPDCPLCKED